MKQLTKEQLIDLVFDKNAKIREFNSEKMKEHILDYIKVPDNNGYEMLVKFVTAYGDEIKRECCQAIAEILYDVLYSE